MNGNRGRTAAAPEGSLLRLGETREIAIYRCDGVSWVADFRGGYGELYTPGEWVALNGGSALRGISGVPLPAEMIEKIERLHAGPWKQTKQKEPARKIFRMPAFARLRSCFVSGE